MGRFPIVDVHCAGEVVSIGHKRSLSENENKSLRGRTLPFLFSAIRINIIEYSQTMTCMTSASSSNPILGPFLHLFQASLVSPYDSFHHLEVVGVEICIVPV